MKINLLLIAFGLLPLAAQANQPLDATLLAEKACPALHSIQRATNPGRLFLQPGQQYTVRAQNKVAATHYLIDIDGQRRWVATDCGTLNTGTNTSTTAPEPRPANRNTNNGYLLAASWQPAFCQTHQREPECSSQTSSRYDASHLALHGLWPQPKDNAYCGISTTHKAIDRRSAWHLLPALPLSDALREQLNIVMPATASQLQRHEWYKHGSCYGTPEKYYQDSLQLMGQLNGSAVRELFASRIGQKLTATQIRAAFDQSFGAGTGSKVNVRCAGKLISELHINLRGTVNGNNLSELLHNAPPAGQTACAEGLVDPAGF